jgi:ABC-2 type transport system permease protein
MTSAVPVIARRELADLLYNRSTVIAGALFTTWFSVYHGYAVGMGSPAEMPESYAGTLLAMSAMVSVFVGYIFSGQAFLFEKVEGIVETLMCTPIRLKELWLGKTLGIAFPAWVCSLVFGILFTAIARFIGDVALIPSVAMVAHTVVVVPLFTVAAVGTIGIWQLVLGMRENQIVNLLLFLVLFFAIFFSRTLLDQGIVSSWQAALVLLVAGLLLLGFTLLLSRFLSKERIVRTIP